MTATISSSKQMVSGKVYFIQEQSELSFLTVIDKCVFLLSNTDDRLEVWPMKSNCPCLLLQRAVIHMTWNTVYCLQVTSSTPLRVDCLRVIREFLDLSDVLEVLCSVITITMATNNLVTIVIVVTRKTLAGFQNKKDERVFKSSYPSSAKSLRGGEMKSHFRRSVSL